MIGVLSGRKFKVSIVVNSHSKLNKNLTFQNFHRAWRLSGVPSSLQKFSKISYIAHTLSYMPGFGEFPPVDDGLLRNAKRNNHLYSSTALTYISPSSLTLACCSWLSRLPPPPIFLGGGAREGGEGGSVNSHPPPGENPQKSVLLSIYISAIVP